MSAKARLQNGLTRRRGNKCGSDATSRRNSLTTCAGPERRTTLIVVEAARVTRPRGISETAAMRSVATVTVATRRCRYAVAALAADYKLTLTRKC